MKSKLFRPSFGGYGPQEPEEPVKPEIDIDIENDLNLGDPDNPIDDIDLGDGQIINRPENVIKKKQSPSRFQHQRDAEEPDMVSLCSKARRRGADTAPHPRHCDKFVACQPGTRAGSWIATVRDCSPGTVFDERINRCNFRENVPRCGKGESNLRCLLIRL